MGDTQQQRQQQQQRQHGRRNRVRYGQAMEEPLPRHEPMSGGLSSGVRQGQRPGVWWVGLADLISPLERVSQDGSGEADDVGGAFLTDGQSFNQRASRYQLINSFYQCLERNRTQALTHKPQMVNTYEGSGQKKGQPPVHKCYLTLSARLTPCSNALENVTQSYQR